MASPSMRFGDVDPDSSTRWQRFRYHAARARPKVPCTSTDGQDGSRAELGRRPQRGPGGVVTWRWAPAGCSRRRSEPCRRDHDRVQVHLDHSRNIGGQAADPDHEHPLVPRRRPGQRRGNPRRSGDIRQTLDRPSRILRGDWWQQEGTVVQDVGSDAARGDHHQRSERRVADHPERELDAAYRPAAAPRSKPGDPRASAAIRR